MPRRSTAQARAVKLETDLLVRQLEEAVASPTLTIEDARALLHELLLGLGKLQAEEEELTDMTERVAESHSSIATERERYERMFRLAPDAYVATDMEGRIIEANAGAEALLAAGGLRLEGSPLGSFVLPDHRDVVDDAMARLAHQVSLEPFEVVVSARPDHPRTVEIHAGADESEIHQSSVVRWLIRDVTERRQLERELSQLRTDIALLSSIAEVTRLVTSEDDPTAALLTSLVGLATGSDADVHAGILLTDVRGKVEARAVSDAEADELCRLQIAHGGPAVDALLRGQQEVRAASDLSEWPELAAEVRRLGLEWVLSQPIEAADGVRGVFNIYGAGSSTAAVHAAALLADQAGAVISNREVYLTTRRVVGHLETALESRCAIEQAKGVLMAREGCDAEAAFDILRRASQRENRKVRDVAATLVAGAAGPKLAPPGPA